MIIKLVRYFSDFDLKKQTPGQTMTWKDFTFTDEDVEACDYLVILDYPKKDFSIKVNQNNIIHLCLEPPNEVSKYRQYANKKASVIYNQMDINKKNNILSHGAIPWHVNKNYDFLTAVKPESLPKEDKIAWITSNQRTSKGHNVRMDYLESIKHLPFVELYGRGIRPIDDKWQALQSAKYAIAYENFHSDYYWTEKIMDCFLSYSMPLYYGCKSIGNYFPEDSFIRIDPNDKHAELLLKETVQSKKWEQHLDAIKTSRELVLEQYQLFPFLYNQIKALQSARGEYQPAEKELMHFKGGQDYYDNFPASITVEKNIQKIKRKIASKFKR